MRLRGHRVTVVAAALGVCLAMSFMTSAQATQVKTDSSPGTTASDRQCVAYATGTGMGSYCNTGAGGGDVLTLSERFGNLKYDRCRYSEPADGMKLPYNPNPEGGRWWVRTCIDGIDFNTSFGGTDRQFSITYAWLAHDEDHTYNSTPIGDFLWRQVAATTQYPVPFALIYPTFVPKVGVPAFFNFRWLDARTKQPVTQGPYKDEDKTGGPYIRIVNPGGLIMEARAKNVTLDPLQTDMKKVDCKEGNPRYIIAKGPNPKDQDSICYLTFPRTSASAREKMEPEAKKALPAKLGDVYVVRVSVTWEVRYGHEGEPLRVLGGDEGFTMVTDQPVPVREYQAANLPPFIR